MTRINNFTDRHLLLLMIKSCRTKFDNHKFFSTEMAKTKLSFTKTNKKHYTITKVFSEFVLNRTSINFSVRIFQFGHVHLNALKQGF